MAKGFLRVFERLLWPSLSLVPATKRCHVGSIIRFLLYMVKGYWALVSMETSQIHLHES
jgi:hypothetical protein